MRNPDRIDEFCSELAKVWKEQCPDWRFGQLMSNVFGAMYGKGRDPFFPEEPEMMRFIKSYFYIDDSSEKEQE